MLLRLALVTLLFLLSDTSRAQKNTLYVWIDTLVIDETQTDVVLDVKFELDADRSPVVFTGYIAHLDFGPQAYATVVSNGLITQNTGSRHLSFLQLTANKPSEAQVTALGSEAEVIDTSYQSLFRLRLTTNGLPEGERVHFLWDRIDLLKNSGIDTVIYGNGYIERRKFVPVPVFDTVRVTLPAVTLQADSTIDIPVIFDSIAGSKVKNFALSFDFDSSLVRLDEAILASDMVDTLVAEIQPTHGDIFLRVAGDGVFQGADTLFYLRFTAKPRTDTSCASLQQVGFLAINPDAKVDATVITVGEICVQGRIEETKGVAVPEVLPGLWIGPNPASTHVAITLPEEQGRFEVRIYDVTGRMAFVSEGLGRIDWYHAALSAGVYQVIVTVGGVSTARQVIIN